MKVGFIGAGKVGQSFALYLFHQGVEISGFYSRNFVSSQTAAALIGCKAYETLDCLISHSDMVGITVNDDQIITVVDELSQIRQNLELKYFFHMSGVHNSDCLKKISGHVFTLHPLKAFPRIETSSEHFKKIFFSLENADEFVLSWISDVGLVTFEIQSEKKALYHTAAVILSNYMVSIIDFGLHQLDDIGIDRKLATEAMWPLIEDTLVNIKNLGTRRALTGPIARGDIETIKMHLSSMDPKSKQLYKAMGDYTLDMTDLDELTKIKMRTLFKEE